MPRPKAYNEDAVLTAAMNCFWHRGYTATSMKDLEEATGLTPGSLYNSFGSKDGLFLRVLDYYVEQVCGVRVKHMCDNPRPLEGIRHYFTELFLSDSAVSDIGCLVVNTSTELGPHDTVVRQRVRKAMKLVDVALTDTIARGQADGSIAATRSAADLAQHLGLLLSGLLVNARINPHADLRSAVQKIVDSVLQ